jgi:hypothetical protein
VIVPKEQERTWISEEIEDKTILLPILKPYPADQMDYKIGMGPKFT